MTSNITVKDALSVNQVVKTTDTAGVHTPHHNVDSLPALAIGANHIGQVGVDNAAGASAVNVQDGGNSLTVDGSVSLAAAIPAGTNNIGDVDIASVAAGVSIEVVGDVAHDAAVAGNPVLNGAEARTTDGTAVASGDAVRLIADTLGKQVVLPGATHERLTSGRATYTDTTAADVIPAAGAGVRIVVTNVLVTNAHATVGTKVELRDGTTVKVLNFAAAAGGGWSMGGETPIFISTANTAVTARCVTTGVDVDVFVSGYTIGN